MLLFKWNILSSFLQLAHNLNCYTFCLDHIETKRTGANTHGHDPRCDSNLIVWQSLPLRKIGIFLDEIT
jgi:hypothetical protein